MSSNPQLARPDNTSRLTKPARKKENADVASASNVSFRCRFIESEANPKSDPKNPNRFQVILLQEGLGNFGDCHFYTRQALESAVQIFEGKKAYANHPRQSDEQDLPERDVRDILGHYENVRVEEGAAGQGCLVADLVVLDGLEWARSMMEHAIEYSKKYPDKEFVGLSINAEGDSDETPIDTFMQQDLPESCLKKLEKAKSLGITMIKPVLELTSAVSCDLVTEAGAGGKIAQLIEQEKKQMKNKGKAKAKEADEKKPADQKDAKDSKEGAGGEQGDANKDAALIKKMLDQYVGEEDHSEETMALGKEAYEAALEMSEGDEGKAVEMAGHALKMSKHMASKKAAEAADAADKDGDKDGDKDSKGKDADAATEASTESETAEADATTESEDDKDGKTKESEQTIKALEAKVTKLSGENAALKESIKKIEVDKHLDKVLRESGLPMAATKKFRESLGSAKTEKEIDEKFSIFKEAYGLRGGEADGAEGFMIQIEKTANLRESDEGGEAFDFSGCVKES
jgi:hypothetical protein